MEELTIKKLVYSFIDSFTDTTAWVLIAVLLTDLILGHQSVTISSEGVSLWLMTTIIFMSYKGETRKDKWKIYGVALIVAYLLKKITDLLLSDWVSFSYLQFIGLIIFMIAVRLVFKKYIKVLVVRSEE
jgi:hypothetical protein